MTETFGDRPEVHLWFRKPDGTEVALGQIQRSTRADMPEFVVECERDPDIPVVHLVPPALALPLHVEVHQTESPSAVQGLTNLG